MTIECFNTSQWGSAAAHQRDHPSAWTPELVESTAAWTAVVQAIAQSQDELARGVDGPPSFVRRCATEPKLVRDLELLCERQLHGLLLAWLMEGVREKLSSHAMPRFWRHHRETAAAAAGSGAAAQERRCQASFFAAVHELAGYVRAQLELVELIEKRGWRGEPAAGGERMQTEGEGEGADAGEGGAPSCRAEVSTLLQALVLSAAPEPSAFASWLHLCWRRSFVDLLSGGAAEEEEEEEGEEGEEGAEEDLGSDWDDGEDDEAMEVDSPGGGEQYRRLDGLRLCCIDLHELGWLPLVEPTISFMLHGRLHATLHHRCAGKFDEQVLPRILAWLERHVTPWLRAVLMPSSPPSAAPSAATEQWLARLRFFLRHTLGSLRISELFDVIIDYPDSAPCLSDLKECLSHTHQHAEAVTSLAAAIDARLLKPGADTANIIQAYVSAIRALRLLDPSGVLLEAVSERVRIYLKARPDTIRQIVTSLTDPETSELLEPATASAPSDVEGDLLKEEGGVEGEAVDIDEIKGDEAAMLAWLPDPIDADPSRSASRRNADVLSMLVNIYGSKALFVNEFRSMLADKLLAASSYDTDREVRNLELLKKRFGEGALQACDVMLRDIAESKRNTRAIHRHFGDDDSVKVLNASIVSRLCWPTLPAEDFELPSSIKEEMGRFEKQYMHHKAPRKLVWKPSLGCVTLDVVFEDRTVTDVSCSPMHAAILCAFGDRSTWPLKELAEHLKMPPATLKKRMVLWLNRGFIVEKPKADGATDAVYEAPTHLGSASEDRAVADEDDGAGAATDTAGAQLEAEMRVYEQYVVGMLTNLEALPLSRIHNMLKMFVPASGSDQGYNRTEAELQRFLNSLVEDGKLEMSAGQFKIRR